jgi:hypothetical protein
MQIVLKNEKLSDYDYNLFKTRIENYSNYLENIFGANNTLVNIQFENIPTPFKIDDKSIIINSNNCDPSKINFLIIFTALVNYLMYMEEKNANVN